MQLNEASPFSRYRLGYIDGFEGNEIQIAGDKNYMMGYEDGEAADRAGESNKFSDRDDSES